jgi:hypothetical protein
VLVFYPVAAEQIGQNKTLELFVKSTVDIKDNFFIQSLVRDAGLWVELKLNGGTCAMPSHAMFKL